MRLAIVTMRGDAVARWVLVGLTWWLLTPTPLGAEEPPPPVDGSVAGVVKATATGAAIPGAQIEVIDTKQKVRSGSDGTFSLSLPAGTYAVRISADGHSGRTIPKLVVKEGKVSRVEVKLGAAVKADKDSIIVNVIARLRRAAESAQLARRQKAAAVSEMISAETIKKSAGSDAGAAVQRATGVTIRESGGTKTVFVRGLGERYTQALLNSSRLPSPDALRRAVPLDLFPTDFLEGIDIVKGYTPDLPGDFSGGLVDMRLRDFPDQLTYNLGLATGGNTETTAQDFLSYDGGGPQDYFGMGESARNWPQSTPATDIDALPPSRNYALARQFRNVWSPETQPAPIDWGANFAVGNSVGPLGFQLGGTYAVRWRSVRDELRRQFENQGDNFNQVSSNRSTLSTRLGGILTGAYRLADNHTLMMRSFVSRSSNDETRFETGADTQGNAFRQTRLRYVEDELAFGQVAGEHHFDFVQVDWRTVLARTTRDEPDTRHTTYTRPLGTDAPFEFTDQSLGGLRLSNETREKLSDSALDLTVPFTTALPETDVWSGLPGKLKFGAAYSTRGRNFAQRRVQFRVDQGGVDVRDPPEEIFAPDNVGPGGVDLSETTNPRDKFKGSQDILASYGMFELPLVRDRLRLISGVRFEDSQITLDTFVLSTDLCPGSQSVCPQSFVQKNRDWLPGLSLIFNPIKDMNVRMSWSQNVSRPELRELAPSEFPAQRGDRATQGNPELQQFGIESYDARWEWFFSPLELASLGFFYKRIDGPIEKFTLYSQADPIDTFVNSGGATLYGIEGEVRKDFGFLRPALKRLNTTLNFTWAKSEVDVPRQTIQGIPIDPTSPTRSLIGQAPFIVTAALEWADPELLTARIEYATSDRVIDSAGTAGFPDTYEERRDRLSLVLLVPLRRWTDLPLSAKLSVDNIMNDQVQFTQGDILQRRYVDGVSFGFGISYSH